MGTRELNRDSTLHMIKHGIRAKKGISSFLNDISIGGKIGMMLGLMVLSSLLSFFVIMYYEGVLSEDNKVIDVAGRQRMLTQRIAVLSQMTIADYANADKLTNAITSYDLSYKALISGGAVPGMKDIVLNGTDDPQVVSKAKEVLTLWKKYKMNAELIVMGGNQHLVEESFTYISSNNTEMLKVTAELVNVFVEIGDKDLAEMERMLLFSLIFTIGIAGFTLWISRNLIVRKVKSLSAVTKKVVEGDLDISMEDVGKDEIGMLINDFKNVVKSLRDKSDFAREIGQGNLDYHYEQVGANDVLGNSLISMRDNLKRTIEETRIVVSQAAEEGKLNLSVSEDGKSGAWKDLSTVLNNLLKSIATPVLAINEIVSGMAEGDLSKRYNQSAKGEILAMANNLNKALDAMSNLLHQIRNNTHEIQESSDEMLSASNEMKGSTSEIASAIAQMSNGAQNQLLKVEESSNLAELIKASSKEMGRRSTNINETARVGLEHSNNGTKMVEEVVRNMSEIAALSGKTNQSIGVLTKRSAEINRVLAVITDIASQTNLLALNAAIEAAQAGDAGRGFAVVAEEIRKLAEDSRKSAQEIEQLISDVQRDTRSTAEAIEAMNESIRQGELASKEAANVFEQINLFSEKTLQSSEEILNATQSQEGDIGQIASITEGIVVIAEQTAAGTEEVASSSEELSTGMANYTLKSQRLSAIADSLRKGVNKFKLVNSTDQRVIEIEHVVSGGYDDNGYLN